MTEQVAWFKSTDCKKDQFIPIVFKHIFKQVKMESKGMPLEISFWKTVICYMIMSAIIPLVLF